MRRFSDPDEDLIFPSGVVMLRCKKKKMFMQRVYVSYFRPCSKSFTHTVHPHRPLPADETTASLSVFASGLLLRQE